MALTPRWGFRAVGGDLGGSILDDDSRYTSHDRLVLDALLNYFENHRHEGGVRLRDPIERPTADLLNVGNLPGATTFYYVVSFIDRYGLESAPSQEVALSTPAPPERPAAPEVIAAAGGTLMAGSYNYGLTRVVTGGDQTPLSPVSTITLGPEDGSVVISLPDVEDSYTTGFGVWRQGAGESGPTKIGIATNDTFTDDGSVPADDCACDPLSAPPTQDLFIARSSIKIDLGDVDSEFVTQDASLVHSWRIYRATSSGGQQSNSLLFEVIALDEAGKLVTTFTDDGTEQLKSGQPTDVSQTLTPSVALSAGSGGTGGGYIEDPILLSPSRTPWRVGVTVDGGLFTDSEQTVLGTQYDYNTEPVLTSPSGSVWRLVVGDDGDLATRQLDPQGTYKTTFADGAGPLFRVTNGSAYRLGVAADGALTVTGVALVYQSGDGPILTAPNGTKYRVTAGNPPTTEVVP